MKLSELSPKFLKIVEEGKYTTVSDIEAADGIIFLCPKCFKGSGHPIICWRPRVPQSSRLSGPGRWEFQGTSFDDLTLVAGSSSVMLTGGCNAHFFVKSGDIIFC